MTIAARHRPGSITVLAVLGFVQAISTIIASIGLLIERNNSDLVSHLDQTSNQVLWYAIFGLVVGAITFFVAYGLWVGSGLARALLGILEIFHLAGGIWAIFAHSGTYRFQGIWSALFALLILYLLYGRREASEFFGN